MPAFPLTLPVIVFVTVRFANVPTLVKLELTILLANVVPVMFVPATLPAEPVTLPVLYLLLSSLLMCRR